jgi:beta-fructofuranosidase
MYGLPDKWIWDFWLASARGAYHIFYLQAPRSLGDPDLRHRVATIGHAVSSDLRTWKTLPHAVGAGRSGAFDDLATWTGSVIRVGDVWMLFYTGISTSDDGRVQRIGAARSSDLVSWERIDGFVLEADARWYEKLTTSGTDEAWRDPWAFRDARTGRYHLFVTARVNHGPIDGRGVIGHVWTDDLTHWTVGPPVSEPGEFVHLEVPQVEHIGDRFRLFFCAPSWAHSAARLARAGVTRQFGTHYLVADDLLGPYGLQRDDFLLGDKIGRYYAGRAVETRDGWVMLAWLQSGPDGNFIGEISDPMPLRVDATGQLRVDPV